MKISKWICYSFSRVCIHWNWQNGHFDEFRMRMTCNVNIEGGQFEREIGLSKHLWGNVNWIWIMVSTFISLWSCESSNVYVNYCVVQGDTRMNKGLTHEHRLEQVPLFALWWSLPFHLFTCSSSLCSMHSSFVPRCYQWLSSCGNILLTILCDVNYFFGLLTGMQQWL